MHGFTYYHPESRRTYTVQHNGDFSGDVYVTPHGGGDEVVLPFSLMQEIVGTWLIQKRINRLEVMTGVDMMQDEVS